MGGSCWSENSYRTYACSSGRGYDSYTKTMAVNYTSASQAYVSRSLDEALDPKGVIRECCDSEEHPNTVPVILALDVTGSMGGAAIQIQKQLNPIMQKLYDTVKDVEIAVMAIGDLAYDDAPIQISQFESDIRIADNLDKIYFENGGGGNNHESYSAAWYVGDKMTRLDAWKRGKKGIIITMGDEMLNPYLPMHALYESTGYCQEGDVDTKKLYESASEKYDIYHICVDTPTFHMLNNSGKCEASFANVIGKQHVFTSNVADISDLIVKIIQDHAAEQNNTVEMICNGDSSVKTNENGEICW